jgi:O-acetyl-ADP-ribose deacetylase (regulator of RNase III)
VDGAIHRAAGPGLLAECKTLGGCETGHSRSRKAICCPRIRHPYAGPRYRDGKSGEDTLLKSSYESALSLCEEYRLKTVAFPSISTGVYRFPVKRAAEIAARTILRF